MSDLKTGLMYSPLTEKVYWGRINTKTGVSVGSNHKDITSDFIGIMLQKFPISTMQKITTNGNHECSIYVVPPKTAARFNESKAMMELLEEMIEQFNHDLNTDYESNLYIRAEQLLAKARGE